MNDKLFDDEMPISLWFFSPFSIVARPIIGLYISEILRYSMLALKFLGSIAKAQTDIKMFYHYRSYCNTSASDYASQGQRDCFLAAFLAFTYL